MLDTALITDHWSELAALLPADFDLAARARACGAFRRPREVRDAESLLRLALGYAASGMSLRQTCAWAAAAGVAELSDPALSKRLAKTADWLGELVTALLAQAASLPTRRFSGHRLRLVDGTALCRPGAAATSWRLHVGYDLGAARIDAVELTDGRGAESFKRFACAPGDILIGDRGYARPRDLRPALAAGGHVIVRIGWNSLRLLDAEGAPFDLPAWLRAMPQDIAQCAVRLDEHRGPGTTLPLRLIVWRKPPELAEQAARRAAARGKKVRKRTDPRTLETAGYIMLLSSLPEAGFPAADVLALYRLRWQIELAFKRLKSLIHLDALPNKTPALARAWIYAKLIAALLVDKMAGQLPDSSPCAPGCPHAGPAAAQPLALAHHRRAVQGCAPRHPRPAAMAHAPRRPAHPAPALL